MDNKQFFEELASKNSGIEPAYVSSEPEADLARASSVAKRTHHAISDDQEVGDGELIIDAYQTANEVIIEVPIAGVNADDLDISITPETVNIKGKRERSNHVKSDDYIYQECYWGRFSRSIVLPHEVDAEEADASLKNGVLTIKLPKLNRMKSTKLKVKGS
ncbi:MAG: hypothetical protein COU07_02290 [Candidatus Harrisonbacteria bacterium CG10_big_fil_rev_8_21_14_0_10_40_38]|uniref:Uncharacterized protein n=1 Tax=Candidatus Harrisonbacteria bacterium CG10_big_fil_rev_8_21_14_0_10_40_38 TaxID=1974583 RepID=A0A2H0US95_9BACT|nr:MAG: hypothetical protein COU07_02290 [Candidatus Harrisonbacteria bacterium CG10_big_fil_rev_8_21_14_0_10_40_38]